MQLNVEVTPQDAAPVLAGVVSTNLQQIERARQAGALASSRTPVLDGLRSGAIRYVELDAVEHWKTWVQVLRDGWGDCEDLASAVAAELLAVGVPAVPVSFRTTSLRQAGQAGRAGVQAGQAGIPLWHVVVYYRDPQIGWTYGDPSVLGGMGAEAVGSSRLSTVWPVG